MGFLCGGAVSCGCLLRACPNFPLGFFSFCYIEKV